MKETDFERVLKLDEKKVSDIVEELVPVNHDDAFILDALMAMGDTRPSMGFYRNESTWIMPTMFELVLSFSPEDIEYASCRINPSENDFFRDVVFVANAIVAMG
jgi:hypothetical protein